MTIPASIRTFRSQAAPWLGLFLVPALGMLLHVTGGRFRPWAVLALLAGTLSWALLVLGASAPARPGRAFHLTMLVTLVVESLILALDPSISYVRSAVRESVLQHALGLFAGVNVLLAASQLHPRLLNKQIPTWFWACLAFLFAARISVLAISPSPHIDVFTNGKLGAQHFWAGRNPYEQSYPDIYKGRYQYNSTFFYGPTYVVASAVAYVLGDVRWATILAEALTVAAMLGFGGVRGPSAARHALILVWLAFPVSLFVLEQTWVDPIVLAAVAWSLRACAQRRFLVAGLCAGLAVGVKQTGVLLLLLSLAWTLRVAGWRAARRYALGAALTAGAAYVPYLLWNAEAIYNSLVRTVMESAPRKDALSIRAWFRYLQLRPPDSIFRLCSIGLIGTVGLWLLRCARSLADLTSAAVLCYTIAFLFGYQAFCNYYWFVGGLIVLDVVVRTEHFGALHAPERHGA